MSPTRGEMEFQARLLHVLERQAKATERVADALELIEMAQRRAKNGQENG